MDADTRGRMPSRATISGPLRFVLYPFREFARIEASGAILLLSSAIVALLWANSPWDDRYHDLFHVKITIALGEYGISQSFAHWINDGLMAVFFLVVGLEIKREALVGELASLQRAALPIVAAIGGMAVPALIYVAVTAGTDGTRGWGVPMATDIAFSLGVLAVLGSRAPAALKVFLTALAIVDDIGAVLVIALFYTDDVSFGYLALAGVVLVVLFAVNRAGVVVMLPYVLLGIILWLAVYQSGLHATLAGILLALTIPVRYSADARTLLARGREIFQELEQTDRLDQRVLTEERYLTALHDLQDAQRQLLPPLPRLEHALHPWVAYFIVPLFALANAGVVLDGNPAELVTEPIALGVILGLFVGKQLGITGFAWLGVRTGRMTLPEGIGWRQIHGAACIAGIGFTMSLFIANLAFGEGERLDSATIGILIASLLAGIAGYGLLRLSGPQSDAPRTPGSGDR